MASPRLHRRNVVDRLAVDGDGSLGDALETGNHPEKRGLAATGRADENDELAGFDLEIDAVDDLDRAEALDHLLQFEIGHQPFLPAIVDSHPP